MNASGFGSNSFKNLNNFGSPYSSGVKKAVKKVPQQDLFD